MAERPRATASGSARSAPVAQQLAARHSTARVAPTGVRRTELPGWFWGALGCLTVLVVGLSVVFVLGQTGAVAPAGTPARAATTRAPATTAAAAPNAAAGARAPGIQVEPMAAPPPAIDQPAPPPPPPARARGPIRPIKMARSPAVPKAAGTAKPVAAAAGGDEAEDEPKPKPRAAAAAADDEAEEK